MDASIRWNIIRAVAARLAPEVPADAFDMAVRSVPPGERLDALGLAAAARAFHGLAMRAAERKAVA